MGSTAGPFFRPVLEPLTDTVIGTSTSNQTLLQEENSPYTQETLQFVSFDPSFDQLLGPSPVLKTMAEKNYSFAHEGPVCLDSINALFFVSNRLGNTSTSNQRVETWLMDVDKGNLTQVNPTPAVSMANGATLLAGDQVLLLSQGANETGGSLVQLDPISQKATTLLNNWFGLAFNSPNDVVMHPSGTIFFTDPSYGFDQLFRSSPQLGAYVWRYVPGSGTPPEVVADGFIAPNGLCFSPDFQTLYVSDTGFFNGSGAWYPARPHSIYTYNVVPTPGKDGENSMRIPVLKLANRQTFATSTTGIPDGIKVDEAGNVYTGVGDGVDVYNPSGRLIGKITTDGVANLAFCGGNNKKKSRLFLLQEDKIRALDLLNTAGADLPKVVLGEETQWKPSTPGASSDATAMFPKLQATFLSLISFTLFAFFVHN